MVNLHHCRMCSAGVTYGRSFTSWVVGGFFRDPSSHQLTSKPTSNHVHMHCKCSKTCLSSCVLVISAADTGAAATHSSFCLSGWSLSESIQQWSIFTALTTPAPLWQCYEGKLQQIMKGSAISISGVISHSAYDPPEGLEA